MFADSDACLQCVVFLIAVASADSIYSVTNFTEIEGMPAWSARLSSNILPQYAVAIASSNLWPGAHTYAVGK